MLKSHLGGAICAKEFTRALLKMTGLLVFCILLWVATHPHLSFYLRVSAGQKGKGMGRADQQKIQLCVGNNQLKSNLGPYLSNKIYAGEMDYTSQIII